MAWKTVFVSQKASFSIKNKQLKISIEDEEKGKQEWTENLEDIDTILIDNLYSSFTTPMIIEASKCNVPILITDQKHDPKSIILPIYAAENILKNFYCQVEMNKRTKGKIWQNIIKAQIHNQILVLKAVNAAPEIIERMEMLLENVLIGDEKQSEAQAARIFFKELYGVDFIRKTGNPLEAANNYGSKIVASKISSTLLAYGLYPPLGVFHKTKTNFFNLSYDLIEPIRPLITYIVAQNVGDVHEELNLLMRTKLVDILNYPVFYRNRKLRLKHAIEAMVKDFVSFINERSEKLYFPEIIVNIDEMEVEEEYDSF